MESYSNYGKGGGIFCRYNSTPLIQGNTITANFAGNDGAGILCYECSFTIHNNTISENIADGRFGGGIFCLSSSSTITDNIITMNDSNYGGGIYCYYCFYAEIRNTIIWNNSAPEGPSIFFDAYLPTVTYTDVEGGWSGTGNIDEDSSLCRRSSR